MKKQLTLFKCIVTFLATTLSYTNTTQAQQPKPRKSLLNNDPDVIYLEEYASKPIQFIATVTTPIYSTKKGKASTKIGTFKPGSPLQLLAMTSNAYRVSGKGKYGKLSGWVNPKNLANKDPKFILKLKKLYKRQININRLIANHQVAIGMTMNEVAASLGKPTKQQTTISNDGRTGSWEFIKYEEQKHYNYFTHPVTGQIYKRFSHITTEEKSKITVHFSNGIVTSISSMEDNGPKKIKIVRPPIILGN